MNRKKRFLLCIMSFFLCFPAIHGQAVEKTFKVVIDAGHGGEDPGCKGNRLKEKDIALAVALKTGRLISDNCPTVQVIYTRKTDVFVELYRRAEIANNNHADLFISFHCNASPNHKATGIETYVMGLHKSEANQAVARAENSAILKEKNYENNYEGYDPNSPEANIAFSLYSSAYLNNSILLADKVQKNLVSGTGLLNREVKQAGFWVLYKVAMPSILIEQGFLSNAEEEKFLGDSHNQDIIASAVYNAFAVYHTMQTGEEHPLLQTANVANMSSSYADNKEKNENVKPAAAELQADSNADAATPQTQGIRFKVQLMATLKNLPLNDKMFDGLPHVDKFKEKGLWKYTAGNETTDVAARKILTVARRKFNDAFIIAFQDEKKISEEEALRLLKK